MVYFFYGMFTMFVIMIIYKNFIDKVKSALIMKYGETIAIMVLAKSQELRHHSLQVLELLYIEKDKTEEYERIKLLINERFNKIQGDFIKHLKKILPYNIKYDTVEDALSDLKEYIKALYIITEARDDRSRLSKKVDQ